MSLPFSHTKAIRSRRYIERQFIAALLKHFNSENKKALAAGRKGQYYEPDADAMRQVLTPHISRAALMGATEAMEPLIAFGLGFSELLVNEAAVEFAKQHIGDLIRGIDNTTRTAVQRHVSTWLQEGDKIGELARALEPTFGAQRAETIAVTEVTNAISGGNIASWQDVNRQLGVDVVSGLQWTTANDERVCPICAPLGGLRYGEDGPEPATIEEQDKRGVTAQLGGDFTHPGGKGNADKFKGRTYQRPPAHPRCRCTLQPVIES